MPAGKIDGIERQEHAMPENREEANAHALAAFKEALARARTAYEEATAAFAREACEKAIAQLGAGPAPAASRSQDNHSRYSVTVVDTFDGDRRNGGGFTDLGAAKEYAGSLVRSKQMMRAYVYDNATGERLYSIGSC
ncbi:MAG: hypothetical protein ACREBU_02695 [Nitrososphaera sp.]